MTKAEKNIEMARILREAADILYDETVSLNEAEAADKRKETKKSVKSLKADEAVTALLKGELDPKDAKKIYDDTMKDIEDLEKKVSEIPAETFSEKFASLWQHAWTRSALVKYFALAVITNTISVVGSAIALKIGTLGALIAAMTGVNALAGAGTITVFNSERETKDGEKNWNKAQAEKYVDRLKTKVRAAYNKHYGSQNESVDIEALLECSYEEFLKFVPAEDDEA